MSPSTPPDDHGRRSAGEVARDVVTALRSPARLSFWSALGVASVASAGSTTGLWQIAHDLGYPLPIAVPVAADLGAFVAATNIRAGRHRHMSWVLLIALVMLSIGLQIVEAAHAYNPWDQPVAFWSRVAIVGGVVLGALCMFHFTLPEKVRRRSRGSADRSGGSTTGSTTRSGERSARSTQRSTTGSAPAAPLEQPALERSSAPTPSDQASEHSGERAEADVTDDVAIGAWLLERSRTPSQRSVREAAEALEIPISNQAALELARALKAPAPVGEHSGAEQ